MKITLKRKTKCLVATSTPKESKVIPHLNELVESRSLKLSTFIILTPYAWWAQQESGSTDKHLFLSASARFLAEPDGLQSCNCRNPCVESEYTAKVSYFNFPSNMFRWMLSHEFGEFHHHDTVGALSPSPAFLHLLLTPPPPPLDAIVL